MNFNLLLSPEGKLTQIKQLYNKQLANATGEHETHFYHFFTSFSIVLGHD